MEEDIGEDMGEDVAKEEGEEEEVQAKRCSLRYRLSTTYGRITASRIRQPASQLVS